MIDFVKHWIGKTEIPSKEFVSWLEIGSSKYYNWQNRYGKLNEHNRLIPRDHRLLELEKQQYVIITMSILWKDIDV